ncbi:MAG: efflux RND transporter periplasmic adaptor subunit [Rhodospirillales bacterium]
MMNSKLRQLAVATVLSVTVWPLSAHHVRAQDQPGTPVEAVKVKTEAIVMETTAVGTLLSNETVIVRPEIEGRLTEIAFDEGTTVKKGQLLFKLDASIYRAELNDAQARLSLAATNFERSQELFKKKAGTERGLDEARAAYRVAEAAVELAKARMTKTTIEAPFEGVVGLRHVSTGDYVTAGKDLVNLEDIDPLKVEFAVPERYLSAVKEGQVVRLTADAFPDETFEGAIYAINPQIDTSGRSIQVRARISNDDRKLRPGLFVRVKVQLGQREQAIMIPEEALVPRGKDRFVFKIVDGKAVETPVQIGLRRVGEVEITSGLAADDMVITAGQLKIRNGVPVKPVGDEPKPADAPKGS